MLVKLLMSSVKMKVWEVIAIFMALFYSKKCHVVNLAIEHILELKMKRYYTTTMPLQI